MRIRIAILVAAIAAGAVACGGSKPEQTTPPPPAPTPPASTDAAARTSQSMQSMTQQTAKAVEFEKLIAFLPESAGWTRTKPKGEQVSIGGTMSKAGSEYQKGEVTIDLEIVDSSFNQLVLSPITMFLAQGYSERSTEGYSKSTSLSGHPGFEKWNNEARRGEVTVVLGNRFIVQATGRNVDNIDPVKALVQAVDLRALAALK